MSLLSVMKETATPAPADHMKALTVWQPWASLIIDGEKEYETRGYSIRYRGPLAIHAAAYRLTEKEIFRLPALVAIDVLGNEYSVYSAILGIVEVVDCIPVSRVQISRKEWELGNYSPGRFAWRMRVVEKFKKPIPYKGAQGLWNLPLSVIGGTHD